MLSRLRLNFNVPIQSLRSTKSLFLIPKHVTTIHSLIIAITNTFGLINSSYLQLSLDGFALPPSSPLDILQNDEILNVEINLPHLLPELFSSIYQYVKDFKTLSRLFRLNRSYQYQITRDHPFWSLRVQYDFPTLAQALMRSNNTLDEYKSFVHYGEQQYMPEYYQQYYGSGPCGCRMLIVEDEHMNPNIIDHDILLKYEWKESPVEKEESYLSVILSADLRKGAKIFLDVLHWMNENRFLMKGEYVKKSILRYMRMMHLKAKYETNENKVALPLDIEVIALAHLVRTPQYRKYCEKRFGKIIGHEMQDLEDIETQKRLNWTRKIWKSEYGDEMDEEGPIDGEIDAELGFGIEEIILDRKWLPWLYESLPGVTDLYDDQLLEEGYKEYMKYLYLSARYPCYVFNPTFQIDLFWHTHMCYPIQYDRDCMKYCGKVLHHEAWPKIDFGLCKRREDTVDLWKKEYCEVLQYRKGEKNQVFPKSYCKLKETGIKTPITTTL